MRYKTLCSFGKRRERGIRVCCFVNSVVGGEDVEFIEVGRGRGGGLGRRGFLGWGRGGGGGCCSL